MPANLSNEEEKIKVECDRRLVEPIVDQRQRQCRETDRRTEREMLDLNFLKAI